MVQDSWLLTRGTKQQRLLDLASANFIATSSVPCLALLSVLEDLYTPGIKFPLGRMEA